MRLAHIYPLTRLPRAMGAFTYLIPEDWNEVRRGDRVEISFRRQKVGGIVASVEETETKPPYRLQSLLGRIPELDLSAQHLTIFEGASRLLLQSTSSLLSALLTHNLPKRRRTLPPPQPLSPSPLTLPATDVEHFKELFPLVHTSTAKPLFLGHLKETIWFALIAKSLTQTTRPTLLLCPTEHEIEKARVAFAWAHPVVWNGQLQEGRRAQHLLQFNGSHAPRLIIGSRLACLLPLTFERVWMWKSSHPSYRQRDRNPRYDTKSLLLELPAATPQVWSDPLPELRDLLSPTFVWHPSNPPPPIQWIDLRKEMAHRLETGLTFVAQEQVQEALEQHKRVLVVYNRKRERRLTCSFCHTTFHCPTCRDQQPLVWQHKQIVCESCRNPYALTTCSHCREPLHPTSSETIQTVRQRLARCFLDTPVGLLTKEEAIHPEADLVITTDIALERHMTGAKPFGLVILTDADQGLLREGYESFDAARHRLGAWSQWSQDHGALLAVETFEASLWQGWFHDPAHKSAEELDTRRTYQQPPFVELWRVWVKDAGHQEALTSAITLLRTHAPHTTITPVRAPHGWIYEALVLREESERARTALSTTPDEVLLEIL